jgi:hypothetical protein
MKKATRLMLIAGVTLAGALGASWQYQSYAKRRVAIEQEIERYAKGLADRDARMSDKARASRELKKVAQTTLGTDEEQVTAALRKALNEVVSHYKLADASVTSARPMPARNPAGQRGVGELRDKKYRNAKATPDFYVLPATLNGKGTLDQALRILATLEEQAWVHKIDSFSIRPVGKERERVELTVSLGTLYLTEAGGVRPGETVSWSPVSDAQYAQWQPLAAKNVFKEPAAPVAAAPSGAQPAATVAALPPPPPPGPAYDQWRVSGITRGAGGPELMVVNLATKQWLTLMAGGVVLDAKFIDAAGEIARISIGDKEFEIKTGQTFAERTPVAR